MNVWLMLLLSEHEDQRSSWMVEGSDLGSGSLPESKDGIPLPPTKPRIWSMAELAVSKSSYVGCGWEAKKEEALPKSAPLSLSLSPSLPLEALQKLRHVQTLPLNTVIIHQLSLSWAQQPRKIRTSTSWGWILEADTVNELHLLPKLLTMLLQL